MSRIGTPTYKLANFLLPFLTPLIENEYNVTDLFHFAEEIYKQGPNSYMASLDVEILYTIYLLFNIPLNETINICIDNLYENSPEIFKNGFRNLLKVANEESFNV